METQSPRGHEKLSHVIILEGCWSHEMGMEDKGYEKHSILSSILEKNIQLWKQYAWTSLRMLTKGCKFINPDLSTMFSFHWLMSSLLYHMENYLYRGSVADINNHVSSYLSTDNHMQNLLANIQLLDSMLGNNYRKWLNDCTRVFGLVRNAR